MDAPKKGSFGHAQLLWEIERFGEVNRFRAGGDYDDARICDIRREGKPVTDIIITGYSDDNLQVGLQSEQPADPKSVRDLKFYEEIGMFDPKERRIILSNEIVLVVSFDADGRMWKIDVDTSECDPDEILSFSVSCLPYALDEPDSLCDVVRLCCPCGIEWMADMGTEDD